MQSKKLSAFIKYTIREIKTNALWGMVIAIAVSLIVNILTIQYIFTLQSELQSLFQRDLLGQNDIQAAQIEILSLEKEVHRLFFVSNAEAAPSVLSSINSCEHDLELLLTKAKLFSRPKKKSVTQGSIADDFTECEKTIGNIIEFVKSGNRGAAIGIAEGKLDQQFEAIVKRLHSMDKIKQKHDIKVYKRIDYELSISVLFTIAAVIVTIGFRLFMFWRRRDKGHRGFLKVKNKEENQSASLQKI